MALTCTSCRVVFTLPELHHDHYKTDWHRYNLKRKVANLPPIKHEEFEKKVKAFENSEAAAAEPELLRCNSCNKNFSSKNSLDNHLKSKKHLYIEAMRIKLFSLDNKELLKARTPSEKDSGSAFFKKDCSSTFFNDSSSTFFQKDSSSTPSKMDSSSTPEDSSLAPSKMDSSSAPSKMDSSSAPSKMDSSSAPSKMDSSSAPSKMDCSSTPEKVSSSASSKMDSSSTSSKRDSSSQASDEISSKKAGGGASSSTKPDYSFVVGEAAELFEGPFPAFWAKAGSKFYKCGRGYIAAPGSSFVPGPFCTMPEDTWYDDEEGWETCSDEEEEESGSSQFKPDPKICLFCDEVSDSTENNVTHMTEVHSFFIPDIEFVSDLDGLLMCLSTKINTQHLCLWCHGAGRWFHSAKAVKRHMHDKGHFKMLYEGSILADYADFYDYTKCEAGDEKPDDEAIKQLLENSDYELVLPSGATIGHRSLALYYRQNLKPLPIEGEKKKKLLEKYRALGYTGATGPAAVKAARDMKYVQKIKSQYALKVGVKQNKFQPHFRPQVRF